MKLGSKIAIGTVLLGIGAMGWAADPPATPAPAAPATPAPATPAPATPDVIDVAPGFKLSSNGMMDVGEINFEIWHFGGDWASAQQHDAFKPDPAAPAKSPNSHVVTGTLTTTGGVFNLTEQVDATDDGVKYSVQAKSDKEIQTNELAVDVGFSTKSFGGKQIKVDQELVTLPAAPAPQGQATIFDKDGVSQVELPAPDGTLIISGNLVSVHVQDDREWGGDRYGVRLRFNPNSGPIKESKIEFTLKWKPAAK